MTARGGRVAIRFRRPDGAALDRFLRDAEEQPLSYARNGGVDAGAPNGFDRDHHCVRLGHGAAAFAAARSALARFAMFPPAWADVTPCDGAFTVGRTLALRFRLFGLWWLNGARIVERFDTPRDAPDATARFGFAYGTLTCHVESGEERFMVERRPDDSVWYDLRSFSRPRFIAARALKPVVRRLQRRFVRGSLAAMVRAVTDPAVATPGE